MPPVLLPFAENAEDRGTLNFLDSVQLHRTYAPQYMSEREKTGNVSSFKRARLQSG